eukprot:55073-Chlamydomonas_euryale.AAC.1
MSGRRFDVAAPGTASVTVCAESTGREKRQSLSGDGMASNSARAPRMLTRRKQQGIGWLSNQAGTEKKRRKGRKREGAWGGGKRACKGGTLLSPL